MSARHPQIRQGKQCHQLCRVLRQATEACLHITELALDHTERVLDLGAYLRFDLLDFALGFVQCAALTQLLVCTAAGSDLPDNLTTFMFWALLYAGVTRVGTNLFSSPCSSLSTRVTSATLAAVPTALCTKPDSSSTPMCAFMPE